MDERSTSVWTDEERPLVRSVLVGMAFGMAVSAILAGLLVGLVRDSFDGATIGLGAFMGFWAGPLVGGTAGSFAYHLRSERAGHGEGVAERRVEPVTTKRRATPPRAA